ncbi:MAG: NADPH-dependent reductase [Conexibacter sp.]|nr:NADPH-dependent reductase [Conexibacter sp.]
MRILAISGSLRRDSHNTALLRAAASLLPPALELELYPALDGIPPFSEDHLGHPAIAVQELGDAVAAADALLIATPEYNSSIPGVLKIALDWLSRPLAESVLRNKPVAVVGASTGMFGAVWAQAETRKVLGAIGARVLDLELAVPTAHEQFDAAGRLTDATLEQELAGTLRALAQSAGERARVPQASDAFGGPA